MRGRLLRYVRRAIPTPDWIGGSNSQSSWGPFDLLLQLLQRRELDLSTASLAAIAHQFAEIVSQASDSIPLIETSEFAAITAKLLTIKSAALLPSAEDEDGLAGEEDRSRR